MIAPKMRIGEVATRLRISYEASLQDFACKFDLYKLCDGATKPDGGTLVSMLTWTFKYRGYHRESCVQERQGARMYRPPYTSGIHQRGLVMEVWS